MGCPPKSWEIFDCRCDCGCGGDGFCREGRTFKKSVQARSRVTLEVARIEAGVPLVEVPDVTLGFWLLAAKQFADRFLGNDFCGDEIPEPVEQGILAFIRTMYETVGASADSAGEGGGPEVDAMVASQSVGGVSISYRERRGGTAGGAGGADALSYAMEAAKAWWLPYQALWSFC